MKFFLLSLQTLLLIDDSDKFITDFTHNTTPLRRIVFLRKQNDLSPTVVSKNNPLKGFLVVDF